MIFINQTLNHARNNIKADNNQEWRNNMEHRTWKNIQAQWAYKENAYVK